MGSIDLLGNVMSDEDEVPSTNFCTLVLHCSLLPVFTYKLISSSVGLILPSIESLSPTTPILVCRLVHALNSLVIADRHMCTVTKENVCVTSNSRYSCV